MKKILVPIDGSDPSKKAAEQAVSFAKAFGSEITFLTVVEIKHEFTYADYGGLVGPEYFAIKDSLLKLDTERAGKMLDAVVQSLDCSGLKIEKKVLAGAPHPQIVKYAEDGKYDLIVMGHRGLNPLQRFFIGSVAKRVIEDAPCSVFIVK